MLKIEYTVNRGGDIRVLAVVLTLLVHVTPVILWNLHPRVIPPPPVLAKPLTSDKEDEAFKFRKSTDGSFIPCERTYRGVGFRDIIDGIVTEVAPGSPAEQSGLMIGDNVLNFSEFGADRYPVGYIIYAKVERRGQLLTLMMRVTNICEDK